MIYYEKKEKKSIGFLVICVFLIVIIYILINLINKLDYDLPSKNIQTAQVTSYITDEKDTEKLINNSIYSVVGISKFKEKSTNNFNIDKRDKLGMCSGVVISQEGYVLTNRHISGRNI